MGTIFLKPDYLPKVLVVDDDKSVLWTLKELLEVHDFDVVTASSGSQALEIIQAQELDCVVMDVVMPGKSGFEVFREIKPTKPELPVIFITGYVDFPLEALARREGVVDVVSKPIAINFLVALIKRVVSGQEQTISQAQVA